MIDQIGKIFGPTVLQVVIGATALYYALIAFARVRQAYFGENRLTTARKLHLEVLKLEAEIAAIRKTAELPPLSRDEINPPRAERVRILAHTASVLWSHGPIGRFLLVVLTMGIQLLGLSVFGFLIVALRYWIVMRLKDPNFHLQKIELNVLVAALLLGSGILYVGFIAFGQTLKRHAPRTHLVLSIAAGILALALSICLWVAQNGELYPTP